MQVLSRMEEYIKQEGVKPSDEAWLIVDRDQWDEKHLDLLHQWTLKCSNYKLALSNPKFEFWLLLHYEDAKNISTERECLTRLKHYLPNYNKKLKLEKLHTLKFIMLFIVQNNEINHLVLLGLEALVQQQFID
jgi:hypothetical protein